jgi:hypothetical protein
MAEIKVIIPKNLQKRIVGKIDKIISNSKLLEEIGQFASEDIKRKAKTRKPYNANRSFPELADSTIARRQRLKQFNETTNVFSPKRSNLSFTGQLLDSITYRLKQTANQVIVFLDGVRKPYKTGPKSQAKISRYNRTNAALASTLKDKGFVVFNPLVVGQDQNFKKRINTIIKRFIRRNLKPNLGDD